METNREHYAEMPLKVALDAYGQAYAAYVKAMNDPTVSIGTFHDWLAMEYGQPAEPGSCPFCNFASGHIVVHEDDVMSARPTYSVFCNACRGSTGRYPTMAEAVTAWNGGGE